MSPEEEAAQHVGQDLEKQDVETPASQSEPTEENAEKTEESSQEKPQQGRDITLVNPDGSPKGWVVLPSINANQIEFILNGIENAGYELTDKHRNKTGSYDLFFKRT